MTGILNYYHIKQCIFISEFVTMRFLQVLGRRLKLLQLSSVILHQDLWRYLVVISY